jgi:hypothetical protein
LEFKRPLFTVKPSQDALNAPFNLLGESDCPPVNGIAVVADHDPEGVLFCVSVLPIAWGRHPRDVRGESAPTFRLKKGKKAPPVGIVLANELLCRSRTDPPLERFLLVCGVPVKRALKEGLPALERECVPQHGTAHSQACHPLRVCEDELKGVGAPQVPSLTVDRDRFGV